MSALILISHVKKGVELAREHKLGPVITDLISQHHGTTLITFFYHKAQELAEAKGEDPVREEEFRYPGPKPQSKEAGLILLADAIEASSRTLVDPTPSRIKGHIQSIVRKIYTEGELDESQLTLKDLTLLTETFHRILTGIFHQRIEYPSADRGPGKRPKECPAEPGKASTAPEQAA
jgi:membrane-associated HD superfamily phosphohydrolase